MNHVSTSALTGGAGDLGTRPGHIGIDPGIGGGHGGSGDGDPVIDPLPPGFGPETSHDRFDFTDQSSANSATFTGGNLDSHFGHGGGPVIDPNGDHGGGVIDPLPPGLGEDHMAHHATFDGFAS